MKRRIRFSSALVCMLAVVVLTACVPHIRDSTKPDLEEAIPEALIAADLGITDASADNGADGFTVYVTTFLAVPDGNVTADELRSILAIVLEHTNISGGPDLYFTAELLDDLDEAKEDPFEPPEYVDLTSAADELGVSWKERGDGDSIAITWDAAVDAVGSSQ